jgi:hypothetical protein
VLSEGAGGRLGKSQAGAVGRTEFHAKGNWLLWSGTATVMVGWVFIAGVDANCGTGRGRDFIAGLPDSVKTRHMLAVFEVCMDGKSGGAAALAAGVSKGSAAAYLNEVGAAAGCRIVRGRTGGCSFVAALRSDTSLLRVRRPGGVRRASVRDFHSFRVTWVTLALTAGVPLELVQKVTGHRTTDIVLKHYFQPGREDFRQALHSAMPKLLTNGHKTPKEEMRELLNQVKPKP